MHLRSFEFTELPIGDGVRPQRQSRCHDALNAGQLEKNDNVFQVLTMPTFCWMIDSASLSSRPRWVTADHSKDSVKTESFLLYASVTHHGGSVRAAVSRTA